MPIRFVQKYTQGFEVIIEAEEGHMLLGERQVKSGAVFDRFADALMCMNSMMGNNLQADRRVKVGKVLRSKGWYQPERSW